MKTDLTTEEKSSLSSHCKNYISISILTTVIICCLVKYRTTLWYATHEARRLIHCGKAPYTRGYAASVAIPHMLL